MPYIKPELRPLFDSAVDMAQMGNLGGAKERILFGIKDLAESDVDGCLNYAFTQLYRKTDRGESETVIHLVMFDVFLKYPRYYKLESLLGLLNAMKSEFKRRGWRQGRPLMIILDSLDNLIKVTKFHMGIYEDRKIRENGDLK